MDRESRIGGTLVSMAASPHPKSRPVPPSVPPPGTSGPPSRPSATRLTPWLAGLLFVVAFAWSAGLLDKTAALGIRFFELYAQSQLVMLEAAGNVADGRAEYAVLLRDTKSITTLKGELDPMTDMRYERESALPGWIVISVKDGDLDAVAALKSADFARLVVPNRGLWICH